MAIEIAVLFWVMCGCLDAKGSPLTKGIVATKAEKEKGEGDDPHVSEGSQTDASDEENSR